MKKSVLPRFLFIAGFFAAALIILPLMGAERLSFQSVASYLGGDSTAHGLIFFRQRIPRVLLAVLVGGSLAVTGAALQVLFRNPLAEPWTLGVAGGAAIGAFAAQLFAPLHASIGPLNLGQALALLGAAAAMGLVWNFASRSGNMTPHTLLLAGVTISVMSGGVIMLATYLVSPFHFVSFHRWMMGGLDVIGFREIWALLIIGGPGVIALGCMARDYNHLALSEDMALGHGVDVARVRRRTFVAAGLATAACVAVAGPIAFVGMIAPHAVRALVGFDHRVALPCSFMLGGAALAVCDGVARTAIAPTEIPVGVITAVIGGPVFLYVLARGLSGRG